MVSPSDAAVFASRSVTNWNELTRTALVEVSNLYNLSTTGLKKPAICQQLYNYFNPPPSAPSSSTTQHSGDVIHISYEEEVGDGELSDFSSDDDDAEVADNDNGQQTTTTSSPVTAYETVATDSSWNPNTQERNAVSALVSAASAPIVSPVASSTNVFANPSLYRLTTSPGVVRGRQQRHEHPASPAGGQSQ